jgi:septal ring factor EnvC (AmiA/AmiB activator)
MNRPVVITGVVAILIGLLVGFLSWGLSSRRLEAQLQDARTSAERLEQQLGDLRTQSQGLEAQLKTEKASLEAVTADLKREKEMNTRLQVLVGSGKK